nr:uncharacterized protein LOC109730970 [Microcebus murinus]
MSSSALTVQIAGFCHRDSRRRAETSGHRAASLFSSAKKREAELLAKGNAKLAKVLLREGKQGHRHSLRQASWQVLASTVQEQEAKQVGAGLNELDRQTKARTLDKEREYWGSENDTSKYVLWHAEYFELKKIRRPRKQSLSLTFSYPPVSHSSFSPKVSYRNENSFSQGGSGKLEPISSKQAIKPRKLTLSLLPSRPSFQEVLLPSQGEGMLHREATKNLNRQDLLGTPPPHNLLSHEIISFLSNYISIWFIHSSSNLSIKTDYFL